MIAKGLRISNFVFIEKWCMRYSAFFHPDPQMGFTQPIELYIITFFKRNIFQGVSASGPGRNNSIFRNKFKYVFQIEPDLCLGNDVQIASSSSIFLLSFSHDVAIFKVCNVLQLVDEINCSKIFQSQFLRIPSWMCAHELLSANAYPAPSQKTCISPSSLSHWLLSGVEKWAKFNLPKADFQH